MGTEFMTSRFRTTLIVGFNLSVLFHSLAWGQEQPAESRESGSKSQSTSNDIGAQLLALIDVNHDGRIGPDEVFSSPTSKFAREVKRHDANSDGYVDAAELKQPWDVPLPPPAVIARLEAAKKYLASDDTNRDGRIGRDEVASAALKDRFENIDKNGDNRLNLHELVSYVRANPNIGSTNRPPGRTPNSRPEAQREIVSETTLAEAKRLLARGDTNSDGKLSRQDRLPPLFARNFDATDTNNDGEIDLQELQKSGIRPFSGRLFLERYDDDGDGVLQGSELRGPLSRNLERLDVDRNGALTENEMDVLRGAFSTRPAHGGREVAGPASTPQPGATGTSWREHFGQGIRLLADGKVDEAKSPFSEAAKRLASIPEENRTVANWGYLGQALYRAGDYQQARVAIEKCNEMRGDKEPTAAYGPRWWYYAMILARSGDTDKAREYYDVMFAEIKSNRSLQRFNDKHRLELAELLGIKAEPLPGAASSQPTRPSGQRNDPDFRPTVANPQFTESNAPTVAIDQGHRNFHTKDGRFLPFADVLEADGCHVVAHAGSFSEASLVELDILVIANALPAGIRGPEIGSAFTKQEIDLLKNWVNDGGSLMLLADHRPYGEAAKQLGEAFGVEMSGGFVLEDDRDRGRIVFSRDNGRLADHPITRGPKTDRPVASVTSFTGQALRLPAEFTPLMSFVNDAKRFADRRSGAARRAAEDVSEWHQGGVAEFGEGRIAVFGEAGMFSAQVAGRGAKMGMSATGAEQNQQFLLNVVRWLAGSI